MTNKKVTGVKPFTWKQLLKIYWLLALWVLFFLYLTIYNAICDCLYLVGGEGLAIFFLFAGSAITTASWWRKQHRKNWLYD